MKTTALSVVLFISLVSLVAGTIFAAGSMSTGQVQNKRVVSYKYPCIVLKVDNYGCQAKMEMRMRVLLGSRPGPAR